MIHLIKLLYTSDYLNLPISLKSKPEANFLWKRWFSESFFMPIWGQKLWNPISMHWKEKLGIILVFAYIFIHSHHVHKSISKISLMLLHMTSILWLNKLQRPGLHVWWLDYFVQWCSSVALMPYNPLALYTLYSLLKYAPITNTYELHFAPWFSL